MAFFFTKSNMFDIICPELIYMEKMEFKSRDELKDYINSHTVKNLGIGREGRCSLLDNGKVIKYLYDDYNPEFVLQFKDIDSSSFLFAKEGIFVDDYVAAILMEYAKGMALSSKKPVDQNIITLGNQLQILSNDIVSISEKSVFVKDFHCGNIIYDGNAFKVIDTLPYLLFSRGNYKNENLREVMNRIYEFLLSDIISYRIVRRDYTYLGRLDRLEYPSEYFNELKSYLENTLGEEINTLGEASVSLKKTIK